MANSRILLISDATDEVVATSLQTPAHAVVRVADTAAAIEAEGEHEVVVIDLDVDPELVIDASREIRGSSKLATVPILAFTHSDDIEARIGLLEAGVDDVMVRPFDPRELDARVEALSLRYQRSRDISRGGSGGSSQSVIVDRDPRQHRVIAIFSPKGGVGTTTVAANVAVALAARTPDKVAVIDLDLQFGQIATHLNIQPRLTVADLVRDEVALRDPGVFQTYTDRHGSSLAVLAAPSSPDGAAPITEAIVTQLLGTAGRAFQYVVVDAGSILDERSETVLAKATDIVIVVTPEFPALKSVHALRELLAASGDELAETSFVLNEIFAREILRPRDIEEALGTKIALTIPYDAFAFLKSVNEGVPVVAGAPRTPAAAQLNRLALKLAGIEVAAVAADRGPRGFRSFFGRD
ncbi:MAG TPA: AAA family ATPase [Candidatus Limnocylindrales bacterium]|nr:AAA family ATPase [Candidatus Limnocylindrales bacterium]